MNLDLEIEINITYKWDIIWKQKQKLNSEILSLKREREFSLEHAINKAALPAIKDAFKIYDSIN